LSLSEEELRKDLCDADQGHIFSFWDELAAEERQDLLKQLGAIDVDQLKRLIDRHLAQTKIESPSSIVPGTVIPIPTSAEGREDEERSREVGEEALRAGRVAVLMVAGGQATRLGHLGPKGTIPITPVTRKSLFAVHSQRVLAIERRYGARVPFLVLVSPHNHKTTLQYFQQENYFGLDPEEVVFFEQGMLPAVDRDGRLLMAERGRIFLSPDGHGGVFAALLKAGLLDQLSEQKIESVFFFQVDNPLTKVADPVFLGHHLRAEAELSLKVVRKRDGNERVGVYAMVDGRPGIIEYSDLPEDLREQSQSSGAGLTFWAGNIAVHVFSVEFLRNVAERAHELPYHMARKRVPHVNERGVPESPTEVNGVKFESYVFDSFPLARKVVAMEVQRSEEFAPVKNSGGEDSPKQSIQAQSALYRAWLHSAGIPVADENAMVEIGPLFALDREELVRKIRKDGLLGARTVLLD
jgi:UDP-N-acetylglucosamine/UDP-N-acetylgalactosamine diphosphorylase